MRPYGGPRRNGQEMQARPCLGGTIRPCALSAGTVPYATQPCLRREVWPRRIAGSSVPGACGGGTVALAAMLCLGCADATRPVDVGLRDAQVASTSPIAPVARALAVALHEERARSALLQLLRESPLVHHSVDFQAALAGPKGDRLAGPMAAAMGITASELQARIASLPPLDVVVPSPAHRRSWHGGDSLLVEGILQSSDAPATFATTGEPVDSVGRSDGAHVHVLLRPRDGHYKRFGAGAPFADDGAISPDGEVDCGGRVTRWNEHGDTTSVEELADMPGVRCVQNTGLQEDVPRVADVGVDQCGAFSLVECDSQGSAPVRSTYLRRFEVLYLGTDHGGIDTKSELEIHGSLRDAADNPITGARIDLDAMPTISPWFAHTALVGPIRWFDASLSCTAGATWFLNSMEEKDDIGTIIGRIGNRDKFGTETWTPVENGATKEVGSTLLVGHLFEDVNAGAFAVQPQWDSTC